VKYFKSNKSSDSFLYEGVPINVKGVDIKLVDKTVREGVQAFVRKTIASLDERFPPNAVLAAFQIFDFFDMPETLEEWNNLRPTYGKDELDVLVDFYGAKRPMLSVTEQTFLADPVVDKEAIGPEWMVFKQKMWEQKQISIAYEKEGKTYDLDTGYKDLLKSLQSQGLQSINHLACISQVLLLSSVWCERAFSMMNNIKTKLMNRMNDATLGDRMMIMSNGEPIKDAEKYVDEAFDVWNGQRTRMISKSHTGVHRARNNGADAMLVTDMLRGKHRQEAKERLSNSQANKDYNFEGNFEDDDCEDDGVGDDAVSGSTDGIDPCAGVGPYCLPKGWTFLETPPLALKDFQWSGKRLAHKFADGWSTGTFRHKADADDGIVEGALDAWVFYYAGVGEVVHKLDNTHYGLIQKWVIVEKRPKEKAKKLLTNQRLTNGQSNPYAKEYASSRS
jgi:hypothetical protein